MNLEQIIVLIAVIGLCIIFPQIAVVVIVISVLLIVCGIAYGLCIAISDAMENLK